MQEQYPYRNDSGKGTAVRRKRRRQRKAGPWMILAVFLVVILAVISVFAISRWNKNGNPLVGTWVYDEYTQYVFEKDGHGELLADDVSYAYTYRTEGETLILDFTEDIVRDCEYTFAVDGSTLTLHGGTGTDGGTYTLTKK